MKYKIVNSKRFVNVISEWPYKYIYKIDTEITTTFVNLRNAEYRILFEYSVNLENEVHNKKSI